MRENYKFFGGLSVLYGIIFTFCLYENTYGITFPVCVIVTLIFSVMFLKKKEIKLQKDSFLYMAGMVLLSISTIFTTSFFLHFFNYIGIILLFFVFMIHQFYEDKEWVIPAYFKRIFILAGTTLGCVLTPYTHGAAFFSHNKKEKNKTVLAVGAGILTAMFLLCIIFPLLISSDLMFAKIFGKLFQHINIGTILGILFTFLAGFTLCYAFFGALCKYNFPRNDGKNSKTYHPLTAITFTGIIGVVYVIYCAIQIIYLFMGMTKGLPDHVTYSEYARGGFFQLLLVGIINIIMILVSMYLFSANKILRILLTMISGCTFIMIFSAGYRMLLYTGAYHLTLLRILVLWFLSLLIFVMAGIVVNMYWDKFSLFRYVVMVVSIFYISLSFARPDVVTAKYNISQIEVLEDEDVYYLLSLSSDAAPEIAKIKEDQLANKYMKEEIKCYFEAIAEDDENIYLRKANYSRIRAKMTAEKYINE